MSKQNLLDGSADLDSLVRDEFSSFSSSQQVAPLPQAPSIPSPPSAPAAPRLDPDRFRLLKKPLGGESPLGQGTAPAPGAPPSWRR
jgi:hypothetical protein